MFSDHVNSTALTETAVASINSSLGRNKKEEERGKKKKARGREKPQGELITPVAKGKKLVRLRRLHGFVERFVTSRGYTPYTCF